MSDFPILLVNILFCTRMYDVIKKPYKRLDAMGKYSNVSIQI